jgi:hypothetical protein
MKSYREARKRNSGIAVDETADLSTREPLEARTVTSGPQRSDEGDMSPAVENEQSQRSPDDYGIHSDTAEAGPSNTVHASQHVENLLRRKKANKENVRSSQQLTPRKKKRMFNEPQEDAWRVEWDEETQGPSEQQEKPAASNKRQQDEEVSEDDGFENDTRPVEVVREREIASSSHRIEPAVSRSSTKRQRVEQSTRSESADHRSSREAELDANDDNNNKRRYIGYVQSTSRSVQGVAMAQPKQPQTRVPWSQEEVIALIEYIEKLGTSWSNIKKVDESLDEDTNLPEGPQHLTRRDQVSLKDKARNLKVDFLK